MVAGALVFLGAVVNATVDVGALLVYGAEYAARVAVKLVFGLGVAYAIYGVARHGLQVDVLAAAHFAHEHHLAGGAECLDGAARLVVVGEKLVEYGVGYLVGHLVGMSL